MILNKKTLAELIANQEYENLCDSCSNFYPIKNINELHDIGCSCKIGKDRIEEYDMLYYEMCNLIDIYEDEIIAEVNYLLEEKTESYYGDPAFSSASDYWGYILG